MAYLVKFLFVKSKACLFSAGADEALFPVNSKQPALTHTPDWPHRHYTQQADLATNDRGGRQRLHKFPKIPQFRLRQSAHEPGRRLISIEPMPIQNRKRSNPATSAAPNKSQEYSALPRRKLRSVPSFAKGFSQQAWRFRYCRLRRWHGFRSGVLLLKAQKSLSCIPPGSSRQSRPREKPGTTRRHRRRTRP